MFLVLRFVSLIYRNLKISDQNIVINVYISVFIGLLIMWKMFLGGQRYMMKLLIGLFVLLNWLRIGWLQLVRSLVQSCMLVQSVIVRMIGMLLMYMNFIGYLLWIVIWLQLRGILMCMFFRQMIMRKIIIVLISFMMFGRVLLWYIVLFMFFLRMC